ncbi:MAG TPA: acyl-CoA dehydrogenase family protein, partial [Candidatus Dormibacteraeota bacterium]
ALDRAADSTEAHFRRLALAVSKYWTCKRAIPLVSEALECLGGNGYVEESIMPRLYREAPVNSLWEGSGNVNALDVLRAMRREPETVTAFIAEVEEARGSDKRLDRSVVELKKELSNGAAIESGARRLVERLAITLQGSLLVRYGDPAVADAFCASRLGGDWGHSFGTLPQGLELASIVQRHRPPE